MFTLRWPIVRSVGRSQCEKNAGSFSFELQVMSLVLEGLSKSVNGETHIHPVNLKFENGTMNVLLGPTSAGKTTLMRLMAGLEKPDTGRVLYLSLIHI